MLYQSLTFHPLWMLFMRTWETSAFSAALDKALLCTCSLPMIFFNHFTTLSFDWRVHTPNIDLMWTNFRANKAFVNMFATCSFVLQWLRDTIPSATKLWIKWNLRTMCLVLPFSTRFFAIALVDRLSCQIVVASCWVAPQSKRTLLNHTLGMLLIKPPYTQFNGREHSYFLLHGAPWDSSRSQVEDHI